MTATQLSIIVITFNNYEELILTIDSVPREYKKFIFIVNGGECEKTKNFIENGEYNGITEKDSGISDAFNKGVLLTQGKWIHFLNSGDILLDDLIYINSKFVKDEISYIYSRIVFNDPAIGKIIISPKFRVDYELARGIPFPHPGLIVRREVFQSIGYFDISYRVGMDFNFICRMILGGFKGEFAPVESVLMDGGGVSSVNELVALTENFKTIYSLGLFGFKPMLIFTLSFTKAYLKAGLRRLFLGKIISFTRSLIYKSPR